MFPVFNCAGADEENASKNDARSAAMPQTILRTSVLFSCFPRPVKPANVLVNANSVGLLFLLVEAIDPSALVEFADEAVVNVVFYFAFRNS
jgi:hypothetical protein